MIEPDLQSPETRSSSSPVVARAGSAWRRHRGDGIPRITEDCWHLAVARGGAVDGLALDGRARTAVVARVPVDAADPGWGPAEGDLVPPGTAGAHARGGG